MFPAAGPDSKAASVRELLRDGEYFASELIGRLEALHRLRGSSPLWPQAAALARRIRAVIRAELERRSPGEQRGR